MGLTRQAVTHIIGNKANNLPENPIKSTSAAEELEAKQRTNADKKHAVRMAIEILLADGVLLSKITGAMLSDMTEVSRQYANSIKADYESEMSTLGNTFQTSTIPPKSKQTSTEDTQRLKDELARHATGCTKKEP